MSIYFGVLTRGLIMLAKYLSLFTILAVTWSQTVLASCDYVISNEWNTGFTGAIRITNNGSVPINGWSVSWRYSGDKITSSWNATVTGVNPYSATNVSWNGVINPGQVVEFGIQGTKAGSTAEKPVVTGTACTGGASSTSSNSIVSSISSSVKSSIVSSSISSSSSSSKSSTANSSAYKGTVYLIGDSTVTKYNANVYPQTGWGQVLPYFFESANVTIDNRAIGGRSSRSFIEEGRWTTVRDLLKKGDYVFVQFGHNDRDFAHAERYTPPADYQTYLRQYVNEARSKGAIPVLVSPMVMNAYNGTTLRNVFTESGNDYRGAMAAVATELKVPFVDLNLKSFALVKAAGQQYARFLYLILNAGEYPNFPSGSSDGTHFQEMGAVEMARLVVEGLEENKTLADVAPLVAQLKPRYPLTVSASVNGAGLITQSHSYPVGTPLTLKTIINGTNKFTEWRVGGKNISSNVLTQTAMVAGGLTVQAIFNGVIPASSSSLTATTSSKASSSTSVTIVSSSKSSVSSTAVSSSKSSTTNTSASSYAAAKILLIGDSTVQNYTAGYYPRTGWGQLLGLFFKSNITVDNRALGGTSSKSFYNNNWAAVKKDIKKGDFVFIQFGINDRNSADPARYAPTDGTFQDYLTRFANETITMGGTPVFVATLVRNSWSAGKVYPAYHDHPVATRALAAQLKVALIDLDAKSTALLTTVGQAYSTRFYYMNLQAGEYPNYTGGNTDDVHFQLAGALEMARLVVEGITDNKALPAFVPLVNQLQSGYPLTVSSSVTNAGVVTRGFNYPAGATLTLKEIPNGTNKFTAWRVGGNQVSTNAIYETKMVAGGVIAQAVFNGVVTASAQQKTASISALAADVTNICINADTLIDGDGWGWEEDQPCQAQQ